MTCPRCDRADCNAVTGRAGPPEVIVVERRCDGEPVDWRARALKAEAATERLRVALRRYGRHDADCGWRWPPPGPRPTGGHCDCNCGLAAAKE